MQTCVGWDESNSFTLLSFLLLYVLRYQQLIIFGKKMTNARSCISHILGCH